MTTDHGAAAPINDCDAVTAAILRAERLSREDSADARALLARCEALRAKEAGR